MSVVVSSPCTPDQRLSGPSWRQRSTSSGKFTSSSSSSNLQPNTRNQTPNPATVQMVTGSSYLLSTELIGCSFLYVQSLLINPYRCSDTVVTIKESGILSEFLFLIHKLWHVRHVMSEEELPERLAGIWDFICRRIHSNYWMTVSIEKRILHVLPLFSLRNVCSLLTEPGEEVEFVLIDACLFSVIEVRMWRKYSRSLTQASHQPTSYSHTRENNTHTHAALSVGRQIGSSERERNQILLDQIQDCCSVHGVLLSLPSWLTCTPVTHCTPFHACWESLQLACKNKRQLTKSGTHTQSDLRFPRTGCCNVQKRWERERDTSHLWHRERQTRSRLTHISLPLLPSCFILLLLLPFPVPPPICLFPSSLPRSTSVTPSVLVSSFWSSQTVHQFSSEKSERGISLPWAERVKVREWRIEPAVLEYCLVPVSSGKKLLFQESLFDVCLIQRVKHVWRRKRVQVNRRSHSFPVSLL